MAGLHSNSYATINVQYLADQLENIAECEYGDKQQEKLSHDSCRSVQLVIVVLLRMLSSTPTNTYRTRFTRPLTADVPAYLQCQV